MEVKVAREGGGDGRAGNGGGKIVGKVGWNGGRGCWMAWWSRVVAMV